MQSAVSSTQFISRLHLNIPSILSIYHVEMEWETAMFGELGHREGGKNGLIEWANISTQRWMSDERNAICWWLKMCITKEIDYRLIYAVRAQCITRGMNWTWKEMEGITDMQKEGPQDPVYTDKDPEKEVWLVSRYYEWIQKGRQ